MDNFDFFVDSLKLPWLSGFGVAPIYARIYVCDFGNIRSSCWILMQIYIIFNWMFTNWNWLNVKKEMNTKLQPKWRIVIIKIDKCVCTMHVCIYPVANGNLFGDKALKTHTVSKLVYQIPFGWFFTQKISHVQVSLVKLMMAISRP